MHKLLLLITVFCLSASPAMANDVAQKYIPSAKKVGTGKLIFMLWDAYDATLYAPNGKWDPRKPYALSIQYFRKINGGDIAQRSVEEIRKQGFSDEAKLEQWGKEMQRIFPDVKQGSELTAVFSAQKSTEFYFGGKHIGSIKGAEFGTRFFNIWLSEKTSEPELRKKLLGLS